MTLASNPASISRAVASDFWADSDPVLTDHHLENDHPIPLFGDTMRWDLRALGFSPSSTPGSHAVRFHGLEGAWNLRARELAMAMMNPSHRILRSKGIYRSSAHAHQKTVSMKMVALKAVASWLDEHRTGIALSELTQHDLDEFLTHYCRIARPHAVRGAVVVVRDLHTYATVLTGGGLGFCPWGTISSAVLAKENTGGELTTPAIPPSTWWPLLRACWQYINVFSHDIFAAEQAWQLLNPATNGTRAGFGGIDAALEAWLRSDEGYLPVHRLSYGRFRAGEVHWTLLSLLITHGRSGAMFSAKNVGPVRRQRVVDALRDGRVAVRPGGLPIPISAVQRADGSTGPWIDGLDPATIAAQRKVLRNACYVFCAALTMMRDSELQSIRKGALTTFYGTPAVRSRLRKGRRGVHVRNWWIIEPVAQAIAVAERLSQTDSVFASTRRPKDGSARLAGFDQHDELNRVIQQFNSLGPDAGLDQIPECHLAPHMFRRTMAIIAAQQPDGEIALGLQLKHASRRALANATTVGYASETPEWAREFEHELQETVAARLVGLWSKGTGQPLTMAGAGAQRLRAGLEAAVEDAASAIPPTQIGDDRLLRNLLRDRFSTFRWGTINHCLGIAEQAACLEGLPPGAAAHGMLPNRCQPTTCRNSVITEDHLPIWIAEEKDLTSKLADRRMAPDTREQLQSELSTVQAVTRRFANA